MVSARTLGQLPSLEDVLGVWPVLLAGASIELLRHRVALGGSQEGAPQDKHLRASDASHLPVAHWSQLVKAQARCGGDFTCCDYLEMCFCREVPKYSLI